MSSPIRTFLLAMIFFVVLDLIATFLWYSPTGRIPGCIPDFYSSPLGKTAPSDKYGGTRTLQVSREFVLEDIGCGIGTGFRFLGFPAFLVGRTGPGKPDVFWSYFYPVYLFVNIAWVVLLSAAVVWLWSRHSAQRPSQ